MTWVLPRARSPAFLTAWWRPAWLDRDRDPDDRRAVVMKSTDKLGELIRTLKHASSRTLEKALRKLPSQTRERLAGDLACVLSCLDEEERVE